MKIPMLGLVETYLKKDNEDIEVLNAGVQTYSTSIYLAKIYHLTERKKITYHRYCSYDFRR